MRCRCFSTVENPKIVIPNVYNGVVGREKKKKENKRKEKEKGEGKRMFQKIIKYSKLVSIPGTVGQTDKKKE